MNMDIDLNYVIQYVQDFNLVKDNLIEVLKECFKFDGTLKRTKYFTFWVVVFLLGTALGGFSTLISFVPVVGWLISLALAPVILVIALTNLGPSVRRLRDAGFSPLHLLWILLCGIGGIIPFAMCFFPSKNGDTQATQPTEPQDQPPANS